MKRMVFVLFVFLIGCEANRQKLFNAIVDNSAQIECYSGGKVIYSGHSIGKIISEHQSDGYYFKDKSTNKFIEVSGDCLIRYD